MTLLHYYAFTIVIALLMLAGCRHSPARAATVNYVVPAACLTKDVRLLGCDAGGNCKKAAIAYRASCAIVEVAKQK